MSKQCTKCNLSKTLDNFSGKKCWCKQCTNEYAKQYRNNNKEIIKNNQKLWYDNVGRELKKEYDKGRLEYTRERDRVRYQTDENYRIIKVLRTRLYKTMKGDKSSKSIKNMIGVPFQYFLNWIEFQFQESMNWDNYGAIWDIDHVQPCSSFDLTNDDQKCMCFNWKNMRPLLKYDNAIKSNKIDNTLINSHFEFANEYLIFNPVPS